LWSPKRLVQICGTLSVLFTGYRGLSLVHWPRYEADHLPPSSAQIKSVDPCLHRPYVFLACLGTTLPLPTPNTSSLKQIICEYNPIQLQHLFKFSFYYYTPVFDYFCGMMVFPPDFSTDILCKFLIFQCILRFLPISPSLV